MEIGDGVLPAGRCGHEEMIRRAASGQGVISGAAGERIRSHAAGERVPGRSADEEVRAVIAPRGLIGGGVGRSGETGAGRPKAVGSAGHGQVGNDPPLRRCQMMRGGVQIAGGSPGIGPDEQDLHIAFGHGVRRVAVGHPDLKRSWLRVRCMPENDAP